MVDFDPGIRATGVTLRNPGEAPLYGQVRVFRWEQIDGEDRLSATDELIANPPLIDIPAKGQQLVRLIRRSMQPVHREESYRLLIDEVLMPETPPTPGVTLRLRYSVPVFVIPSEGERRPRIVWRLALINKQWYLYATNDGDRRAQVSMVSIESAGAQYPISKGLLGYALPGQTRRWKIALPARVALHEPVRVLATINALPGAAATASIETPPSAPATSSGAASSESSSESSGVPSNTPSGASSLASPESPVSAR